jgi:hypothetical protein
MSNPAWKMYVFREGKYDVAGAELVFRLRDALSRARNAPEPELEDRLLGALIAAGELECAVLDAGAGDNLNSAEAPPLAAITDELAGAFLSIQKDRLPSIMQRAVRFQIDGRYRAAVQEGFAYYALHPRKLALLLDSMLAEGQLPHAMQDGVRVLGIRSIGLTLSAVACAALEQRGIACRRTSVRPSGHPYDRRLEASPRLRHWVGEGEGEFLVVDEGPGISGSSFLAVAEALETCGVSRERIHMVGSREIVVANTLLAPDAARRWPRFSFHAVLAAPLPPDQAGEVLTPGIWQSSFRRGDCAPFSSWTALEPAMFLSRDRQSTFCFAGFGHYGEAVCARARLAAVAGFAPPHLGSCRGFRQSAVVPGKTSSRQECSPELLARMAAYVAFRAEACAVATPQSSELEAMLRWNWQIEFGTELGGAEAQLKAERVAVCDGQMRPEQWLRSSDGELLKLDADNLGDNHFFPGPCDIAWDLAGCIVEWELRGQAREQFLTEYTRRSGDTAAERLGPYLLAYSIFRMAHSRMAAAAMEGEANQEPLQRDYLHYRAQALRLRPVWPESAGQCGEHLVQPGLQRAESNATIQIPRSE